MPDEDKSTDKKEATAPAETDDKPEQVRTTETRSVRVARHMPPWPMLALGIFATVVTLALIVVSWMLIASHRQARTALGGQFGPGMNGQYGDGHYFRRRGGRGAFQAVAARGVVAAVNGDSLTVSGSGKQVTVNKSSATITGDKTSVAVNDNVAVYGTTNSDGSVTASRIVVRNQTTGTDAGSGLDSTPSGA